MFRILVLLLVAVSVASADHRSNNTTTRPISRNRTLVSQTQPLAQQSAMSPSEALQNAIIQFMVDAAVRGSVPRPAPSARSIRPVVSPDDAGSGQKNSNSDGQGSVRVARQADILDQISKIS